MRWHAISHGFLIGAVALAPIGDLAAQPTSCTWPMNTVLIPSSSGYFATANNSWGINGNQSRVILDFQFDPDRQMVVLHEWTFIDMDDVFGDLKTVIETSEGWRELQSRLSCENRFGDVSYSTILEGRDLRFRFSGRAEKRWCASGSYPCPTWAEPLRTCIQNTNGTIGASRIETTGILKPRYDQSNGITIELVDVQTKTSTSPEQDFVRDLFGGYFGSVFGLALMRDLEKSALNDLRDQTTSSIKNNYFRLSDGSQIPQIQGYNPRFIDVNFAYAPIPQEANKHLGIRISREALDRESTMCYIARQLKARPQTFQRR